MPGPKSKPRARTSSGQIISGKTALRRAHLSSGSGLKTEDYERLERAEKKSKKKESE